MGQKNSDRKERVENVVKTGRALENVLRKEQAYKRIVGRMHKYLKRLPTQCRRKHGEYVGIIGSRKNKICIISPTFEIIGYLKRQAYPSCVLSMSKGGSLAIGGYDGMIYIWNFWNNITRRGDYQSSYSLRGKIVNESFIVKLTEVSPIHMAVGLAKLTIIIWNVFTLRRIRDINIKPYGIWTLMSGKEGSLIVGDEGGHISFWNSYTGINEATLHQGSPIKCLLLLKSGNLVTGFVGLSLWDTHTRNHLLGITEHSSMGIVSLLQLKSNLVVVGDLSGLLNLWSLNKYLELNKTSSIIARYKIHQSAIAGLIERLPNLILSYSFANHIHLLNLFNNTGRIVIKFDSPFICDFIPINHS